MTRSGVLMLALCFTALPTAAWAQEEMAVPQVFSDLVNCRTVSDDAARLACYDQRVGEMQAATENESLVVVERSEVQEAERGLFGLRLPRIRLFGGSDDNRVNEIESTIVSVGGGGRGRGWIFRLEDGSLWEQIELRDQLSRDPRAGQPIVIRRAALGSFRAEVDGMRPIRVSRRE